MGYVFLKHARIPLFHHRKSNHIFTVWQHIVLLAIRQYEGKSYRMFVVEWLIEAYYFRTFLKLSHIPHHTTLQKFSVRISSTILRKVISSFILLLISSFWSDVLVLERYFSIWFLINSSLFFILFHSICALKWQA